VEGSQEPKLEDLLETISDEKREVLISMQTTYEFKTNNICWGSNREYAEYVRNYVAEIHDKYPLVLWYAGTRIGRTHGMPPETAMVIFDERKELGLDTEISTEEYIWNYVDWNSPAKRHKVKIDIDDVPGEYLRSFLGAHNLHYNSPKELFTTIFITPEK